ncbi:hypothetical protein [Cytobacillus purgationiresistens]|uniref:Uncharacterized protein n=1 Tax=Cytobacillus purgationiresistens TaxID=863449 RepID=A0ABU0ATI3_9BACI|nr:hypothetical protein [Cytobacillus purgationiresistens]MDQ0273350.1 hypothetical protein [Cytobacillus purgationiresistens]
MSNSKSGYTKIGFSKSFGCCSHFSFCEEGTKACYYENIDPEVQECCRLWISKNNEPMNQKIKETEYSVTNNTNIGELEEQLSLF